MSKKPIKWKSIQETGLGPKEINPEYVRYLERQLEGARKDSERLDWLFQPIIPKTDKGEDAFATWHCAYSSRQAIDKAKEESK